MRKAGLFGGMSLDGSPLYRRKINPPFRRASGQADLQGRTLTPSPPGAAPRHSVGLFADLGPRPSWARLGGQSPDLAEGLRRGRSQCAHGR